MKLRKAICDVRMEKYSVLVSLYYKEKPDFFRAAIQSMISQTVKPDEIVVVEDGPLTDALYEEIDSFKKEYPELFTSVVNETNLGLGLALNRGVEACRNNLVARMDTDDIAVVNRCELQLRYFEENPQTTILGGQIEEFIDSTDNVIGKRKVPEQDIDIKEFTKKRCPFNHMTVMFKKDEILKCGNYQDWFWNEDYYLWIRLALQDAVFANLPNTLVYTRVGPEMYKRRGGRKYFKSEIDIQKYMYRKGMISPMTFAINYAERLVLQVLLPNSVRGWVFKKFARE